MKWIFVLGIIFCMEASSLEGVVVSSPTSFYINYCTEALPQNLNPQKVSDSNSIQVTHLMYDRLLEFKKGGLTLEPGLAESWTVSKDQKTYTFHLRKKVSFHENIFFTPTRFLNSDDVIFSFKKMIEEKHPFYSLGSGEYEYANALNLKKEIKNIQKIDDYSFSIELMVPNASFLSVLAMDFMSILSEEYILTLQKLKKMDVFESYPIGTGPYFLSSFAFNKSVTMNLFEKYWRKKYFVSGVHFALLENEEDRYAGLYSGACDIVNILNQSRILTLKEQKSPVTILEKPGLNTSYLVLNTQKKPFDNIQFREAISLGMNRKKYLEISNDQKSTLAKNLIPPFVLGYNEQVSDFLYQPQKAKKILKDLGYIGFQLDLWVLPIPRPYMPQPHLLAQMIQSDLKAIGLDVKLVSYDWPQFLKRTKVGEHAMALMGWVGDHSDPDNFLSILLSCPAIEVGSNRSRWCSQEFDDLIFQARSTLDIKKRSDLYRKSLIVARANIPLIPLGHTHIFRFVSKRIQNYKISPMGLESLEDVRVTDFENKK